MNVEQQMSKIVMRKHRRGMSLLEVLLAMGILFGSLAVLSQLAFVGRAHLERAEDASTATRLCQYKLGEIIAGIQPLEVVDDEPMEEDPNWNYSIEVQPLDQLSLTEVRVHVYRSLEEERRSTGRRGRYHLVRWIYREGENVASERTLPSPSDESTPRNPVR